MFKIFLDNLSLFEIKSKILFDFVYFGIHVIMNSSGFNSGSSPRAGLQVLAQILTHLMNNWQFLWHKSSVDSFQDKNFRF